MAIYAFGKIPTYDMCRAYYPVGWLIYASPMLEALPGRMASLVLADAARGVDSEVRRMWIMNFVTQFTLMSVDYCTLFTRSNGWVVMYQVANTLPTSIPFVLH